MKKYLALCAMAALWLMGCGNDNSSSPEETSGSNPTSNIGSSSSSGSPSNDKDSNSSEMISFERSDRFSFFDEKNLRYYFLEEDCLYDSTQNKFVWQASEFQDAFNNYEYLKQEGDDSLQTEIRNSFGFRISNDSLYECDYIGDLCTDSSKAQTVYVGNPSSIFGNWTLVGRIYHGEYRSIEKYANVVLTLSPKGRVVKQSYDMAYYKFALFCGALHGLFEDGDYSNQCEKYVLDHYDNPPEKMVVSDDFWMSPKTADVMTMSIKNQEFDVTIDLSGNTNPKIKDYKYTISYNNVSCSYKYQSISLDQQSCEEASPAEYKIETNFSDISGDFVPMLKSNNSNEDEFEECIAQFGFK